VQIGVTRSGDQIRAPRPARRPEPLAGRRARAISARRKHEASL